ncbi:MAG: RHS repeat protein [Polyangiaceae bacterium]|nr:RHS repeat protein [Polyangiaceae bacterium]
MSSTIAIRDIATTGSDHVAPGPAPATSLAPPTPPAGPVPAPFLYIARSSTATGTASKLSVGGSPALVVESAMKIEQPGNITCQPTGGDVVTHMVDAKAATFTGADSVKAEGKKVCCSFDSVYLNVPTGTSKVAQLTTKLVGAGFLKMLGAHAAGAAAQPAGMMDPVSAATGDVFDEDLDLVLRGLIPVEWKRLYSSSRAAERTPLGRGGWTHNLHQSVAPEGDGLALRASDGQPIRFPAIERGASAYHRGKRLTLTRTGEDAFEVATLEGRLTRAFAPLAPGGPAMLRATRDAWGNTVQLVYEGDRLVRVVGPSGRELRLAHDDRGRILQVEAWSLGAAAQVVSYAYGEGGELECVTDALGGRLRYAYDGAHRLVKKTLPGGLSIHYEYDLETGRCVRTRGDGGLHAARFEYDVEKGTTTLTGTPAARVYGWDRRGAVVLEASTDGAFARKLKYDDDLLLTKVEDALGNAVEIERDERGQVTRVADAEGRETLLEYDEGLQIKQIDPGGFTSEYHHDARGALVRATYPSGLGYELSYDGRGRVLAVTGPDGLCAAFEYDEQDNAIAELGPLGERTAYTFDPMGRVTSVTDALGRAFRMQYDALGRMIRHTSPDGAVVEKAYDALGRLVEERDPVGGRIALEHAGVHSLRRQTMQDGQAWTSEYDSLERLRAVKNPRQEAWEYRYDRAGKLREERTFDGRVIRYQYARNERPLRIDRNDGAWRTFKTDATGRVLEEGSPHGALIFERDELGRVIRAVVDEARGPTEVRFEYDRLGRQVAEIQDGYEVRYEYDARNQIAARILPGGVTTRYQYDLLGQLVRVDHDGRAVTITRDALGNERSRRLHAAGMEVISERDRMDRLVRQRVLGAARPGETTRPSLLDRAYEYDARGWLLGVDDSRSGPVRYDHDRVGQLVEVRRGASREVIRYDAAGSVVGVHRGDAPAHPWLMRPGNVLVRTEDAELEYDDARRRTLRRGPEGETEYLWDCRDRLREVRPPSGERVLFTYDAYGRRVLKEIIPETTQADLERGELPRPRTVRYLWEGRTLAAEIDSERGTRVHVHEPRTFSPILQAEQGEVFACVHDHLHAVRELVDERGDIVWSITTSAWGAAEAVRAGGARRARPVESPFRLLGHYHDEETGLCYARFRYFDPATARWLSPDPLGLHGSRNPAGFCGSPVVHVDPLGLNCNVGSPAFDLYIQYSQRAPAKPGYYDVNVHGSPNSVGFKDANGNWTNLTPQQLAAIIKRQSDYTPGTPVRLNSCNVGRLPDGFAQQLANELNAPVNAPNRTVWANSSGGLWVGDKAGSVDPLTGVTNPVDNPGTYVDFNPPPAAPTPTPAATPPP